jgi:hypothetical protein
MPTTLINHKNNNCINKQTKKKKKKIHRPPFARIIEINIDENSPGAPVYIPPALDFLQFRKKCVFFHGKINLFGRKMAFFIGK